ncbi:hypothetical protein [Corynebacterium uterequi]|uniref:Uncharacterized protein n=1 Tax=Corynebacterium uterequi TaxID=1072256 RepID=A0A0G3HCW2_9CORY|nr:hypothetical protein [Corynebacterium uterequi]AKK10560.1 hypothetical protein CUTER_02730 [Corynebacterium uterequi]
MPQLDLKLLEFSDQELTEHDAMWTRMDELVVEPYFKLTGQSYDREATRKGLNRLKEAHDRYRTENLLPFMEREYNPEGYFDPADPDVIETMRRVALRMLFQFRHHQFAVSMLLPALEAQNNQPSAVKELLAYFGPTIPLAAWVPKETFFGDMDEKQIAKEEMSNTYDLWIMMTTVIDAHKELGLPMDTVYPTQMELNHEVDNRVAARKIQLYTLWSKQGNYPMSAEKMGQLWRTEQQRIINEVTHEYLTEPIVAKYLAEEEHEKRAMDLL